MKINVEILEMVKFTKNPNVKKLWKIALCVNQCIKMRERYEQKCCKNVMESKVRQVLEILAAFEKDNRLD